MSDRVCPKPGCGKDIPRLMYACREHWFELPKEIRVGITDAFSGFKRDPLVYMDDLQEWQDTAQAFWGVGS